MVSEEGLRRLEDPGVLLVPVEENPVDLLWHDRPGRPMHPAEIHPLAFSGRDSAEKRAELAAGLRTEGIAAAVLSDPGGIAWMLNIRGSDLPHVPVMLAFAVLHEDGRVDLLVSARKVPEAVRAWLGPDVTLAEPDALGSVLDGLAGRKVRVDPAGTPVWFAQRLRAAGAEPVSGSDPTLLARACKNVVEQEGARQAHRRDAVAVCRFLHWLATEPGQTELTAVARLTALRAEVELFRGESFSTISGAGEHGAVIHYRVTDATDRLIRPGKLYLVDSGGQYADGTTDVTRTVWIGPGPAGDEERDRYTRVLKGLIAIARLTFPAGGVRPAPGRVCARKPLAGWSRL